MHLRGYFVSTNFKVAWGYALALCLLLMAAELSCKNYRALFNGSPVQPQVNWKEDLHFSKSTFPFFSEPGVLQSNSLCGCIHRHKISLHKLSVLAMECVTAKDLERHSKTLWASHRILFCRQRAAPKCYQHSWSQFFREPQASLKVTKSRWFPFTPAHFPSQHNSSTQETLPPFLIWGKQLCDKLLSVNPTIICKPIQPLCNYVYFTHRCANSATNMHLRQARGFEIQKGGKEITDASYRTEHQHIPWGAWRKINVLPLTSIPTGKLKR